MAKPYAVSNEIENSIDALKQTMAARINEAMSRNKELFREGRGRAADFAERYGLMRTVAHRILTGETFVGHVVLLKFSEDVGVPIGWLYGAEDTLPHLEDEAQCTPLELSIHEAPGYKFIMPNQMMPHHQPESIFLAHVSGLQYKTYAKDGDFLQIERVSNPSNISSGTLYAVQTRKSSEIKLVLIHESLRGQDLSFELACTGRTESYSIDEVAFSPDTCTDHTEITVLGKVVGRIGFDQHGIPTSAVK